MEAKCVLVDERLFLLTSRPLLVLPWSSSYTLQGLDRLFCPFSLFALLPWLSINIHRRLPWGDAFRYYTTLHDTTRLLVRTWPEKLTRLKLALHKSSALDFRTRHNAVPYASVDLIRNPVSDSRFAVPRQSSTTGPGAVHLIVPSCY